MESSSWLNEKGAEKELQNGYGDIYTDLEGPGDSENMPQIVRHNSHFNNWPLYNYSST